MVVIVGKGILTQILKTLVDGVMVVFVRISFHHGDRVQGTGAKTGAQSVTVDVAYQLCLAVDDLQSAFGTIRHTQSAPITLVFIDMNHSSDCHFNPPGNSNR
jgi:hypothetical protein